MLLIPFRRLCSALLCLSFFFTLCLTATANADCPFELIAHRDPTSRQCTYLALRETQLFRALPDTGYAQSKVLDSGEERIQFIARDEDQVRKRAESICGDRLTWNFPVLVQNGGPPGYRDSDQVVLNAIEGVPPLEVESLITSGDSTNRVDLVFFADGYTAEEKSKFLEDAFRLAEDISGNQTFYTVKPLLNFWAAFSPSKESGIGSGGHPKDTPFGLYRDGTELRAVYYSKPEVARAACFSLGTQCDYPILMGNDPLYGGLGGEFTVITPSLANGPLVLRHELGHSIIDVGEEYDGGYSYFGVNAAHNTSHTGIPWSHWLTPTSHSHSDEPAKARVERSVMPLQAYPWTLLNTSASWSTTFESSGKYAWHLVRFSLSGVPSADDLRVDLDGRDLGWVPRKDIGVDRWHYDIKIDETLKGGEHEVRFTLKNEERAGEAQLCSVEILEFGDESEFVTTPGHYSLYPTYSDKNVTSYRPTNEDCLMRIVTTPNFCKACVEGLWHALLRRVSLIDDLHVSCLVSELSRTSRSPVQSQLVRKLSLDLVPLAQLRDQPVGVEESYEITWTKDGQEVSEFKNKTTLVDSGDAGGSYLVKVRYRTEEVRVDPNGLLESTAAYAATTGCAS